MPNDPPLSPLRQAREDWIDYLARDRNASANTIRAYGADSLALVRYLESARDVTKPADVTEEDVRHWFVSMNTKRLRGGRGETLSDTTKRRRIQSAISWWGWMQREGLVDRNVIRTLPYRPPRRARLPKGYTEEEVKKLLDAFTDHDFHALRDRAIVHLIYSTAARNAEIVRLDVADLDLDRREVRIRQPKQRRERLGVLGAQAVAVLRRYLDARAEVLHREGKHIEALFPNLHQGSTYRLMRITDRSIRRIVNDAADRARVRRLPPHALRHSAATHMLNRGASLRDVQEQLGHRSISTTVVYTHVDVTRKRKGHDSYHADATQEKWRAEVGAEKKAKRLSQLRERGAARKRKAKRAGK